MNCGERARNHAAFIRHHTEVTSNFHILSFTMEVSACCRERLSAIYPQRDVHLAGHLTAAAAIAHDVPLLTLHA